MTEIQAMKRAKHVFHRVKQLLLEGFSESEVKQFLAGVILDASRLEVTGSNMKYRSSKWDKRRGRPRS